MLEFADLRYRYKGGAGYALDGLSFSARTGAITAVLGPNGCGKSTALGIAAGWLKPSSGTCARAGRAAFLPQSERLAYAFSCLEYVTFGRAPHLPYLGVPSGKDEDLAAAALDAVGMGGKRASSITALSGGELQLVRIARALAQDAPWVLLDEPTDMLDPAHVLAVGAILGGLAASGKGVLLTTHDLAFALSVAHDAALFKEGRLAASGAAAAVLSADRLGELYGVPFGLASVPAPLHGSTGRRKA